MCASVSPIWTWLRVPDWMFPFLWVHSCYRTFERKGKYNITLRYPLKDPNILNHSARLVFPWHLTTDSGDYASVFLGKPLWMKLVPDAKFAQAAPWVVIVIAVKLLCETTLFSRITDLCVKELHSCNAENVAWWGSKCGPENATHIVN